MGGASDGEAFWQSAKTNLQAGRVRLVFVADEIPAELRRVVEFLNEQMDPAEVLAVEVKQYTGEGKLKTLVPRLIGQTAAAQQQKKAGGGTPKPQKLDEAGFLDEMSRRREADECRVVQRLVDWAKEQRLDLTFGKTQQSDSFIPVVRPPAGRATRSRSAAATVWWFRCAGCGTTRPFATPKSGRNCARSSTRYRASASRLIG